jgi:hypothetical protein
MHQTKIKVEFPDGTVRHAELTWKAIDYLLEKYESIAEAYAHIGTLTLGPTGVTKKSIESLQHFIVALFITEDPEITIEKIKELIPYNRLADFTQVIQMAVNAGKEAPNENPTVENQPKAVTEK